jgi:membrane-bound ClpP family serine protease
MGIITIIILILLGIMLLLVEFMLIPGITIAGVGCVISFGAAIFLSFKYFGTLAGFIALAAVVIFVPLFLYFFFKGRAVKPMMLESDIDGKVKTVDEQLIHPGDTGITTSRCTPGGKAKINGSVVEVRSLGSFIDPHTPGEVVKIEGNIVIVKPIK